jgi:RND family efflux transporter MFP subunit
VNGRSVTLVLISAAELVLLACGAKKSAPSAGIVVASEVTHRTTIEAPGTIQPEVGASVRVGPRVSGVLQRLHVRVGDCVSRGDLLAELDDRELRIALRAASVDLQRAKDRLSLNLTERDRVRSLVDDGLASRRELEVSESAARVAVSDVATAEAREEDSKLRLGWTRVFAPIGGCITSISTQQGETVASSFAVPTFLTIVDLHRLEVHAYVDEVDIQKIRPKQRATFTADAVPGSSFEAHVRGVLPQPITRNNVLHFEVLLDLATRDSNFRPEMSVTVIMEDDESITSVTVPSSAVRRDSSGQAFVEIVDSTGTKKRSITVGDELGDRVVVTAGVAAGERLLDGKKVEGQRE